MSREPLVKQEPEWDGAGSPAGELRTDQEFAEHVVIKEEDVKEEAEEAAWEASAAAGEGSAAALACAGSAAALACAGSAAALARLYAGHEVKDELVLGPERLQPPDVAFTFHSASAPTIIERPVLRDGVVRLERVLYYGVAAARRGAEPDVDRSQSGGEGGTAVATLAGPGTSTGRSSPHTQHNNSYNPPADTNKTDIPQKTDFCKKCLKSFTHSGPRPSYCERCLREVKRSYRPPERQLTKPTSDIENPYRCGKYNSSFNDEKSLTSHDRVHTEQKPYSCTVCEKRFMLFYRLLAHERIHTNERPFRCRVCEKSFSWLGCLKSHERVHTGEKPYSCGRCGLKFWHTHTMNILYKLKRQTIPSRRRM